MVAGVSSRLTIYQRAAAAVCAKSHGVREFGTAARDGGGEGIGEMSNRDRLFQAPGEAQSDFVFDERVAQVFPDMINRSVPGYGLVVPLLAMLARRYARDDSRLYDLGCSLGAVALAMGDAVKVRGARIIAVDNSVAMIERLRSELAARERAGRLPIVPVCQDVLETDVQRASVVVLNFTLQFIDPQQRLPLLQRIGAGMLPGGVLLLSEKLRFDAADEQELQTAWHHDFKRSQGYSELEIAGKREALEHVLRPDTLEGHRRRLQEAGFGRVYTWFRALNFASLAAFRDPIR